MLGLEPWVFWVAMAACVYMAWNIGANDVANAMGTSVGSHAITLKQAVLLAAVFEFAGAFLVGGHVTDTVRKGIVSPAVFQGQPELFVLGMLAAILAAGVWLHLATFLRLPVSTTHSIIGAIVGFGLLVGGMSAVHWGKLGSVVLSWIVSPLCGGLMGWLTFTYIKRSILTRWNPIRAARTIVPVLIFPVAVILVLSILYKGLKNLNLDVSLNTAIMISLGIGVAAFLVMKIILVPNDVANAIGPFAAIVSVFRSGDLAMKVPVPVWILALGGVGIVVGLATWGYRVIETVGKKITHITPSRGFSAQFATATTVLVCSKMGLPISTSHTLVGSVIGVGLARGIAALNLSVILSIVNSWIITIPATAIVTVVIYLGLKMVAL
jgi:PiT family inorganic phosphate transporter